MTNKGAKEKRIAIFDLDGTLVNSDEWASKELIKTFDGLGVSITNEEANIAGKRDKYALATKYGFSKEELDKSYRENVKHVYTLDKALNSGDITLYPETLGVLDSLRDNGVALGLLPRTSREENISFKVQNLGLEKYFKDNISIVHNNKSHTKYQRALDLLKKVNGQDGKVYCIGDREEDVVIANDLRDINEIDAKGIFIDRLNFHDTKPEGSQKVRSLEEIPGLILGKA